LSQKLDKETFSILSRLDSNRFKLEQTTILQQEKEAFDINQMIAISFWWLIIVSFIIRDAIFDIAWNDRVQNFLRISGLVYTNSRLNRTFSSEQTSKIHSHWRSSFVLAQQILQVNSMISNCWTFLSISFETNCVINFFKMYFDIDWVFLWCREMKIMKIMKMEELRRIENNEWI
jgi:hypothetical protein